MAYDLSSIKRGKRNEPPRVLVYGEHGIGKSTFAASAPGAIVVPTEDGVHALDVASFPLAKSYKDVAEALGSLMGEHDFSTVVIDSLDWMEQLIWAQVAADHEKPGIEDIGYAKGYTYAADYFRALLEMLDLVRARGMAVVLTAHAQIKRFDDPTTDPYDRYLIKLHPKAAGVVQEWCDVVAFATQDVVVHKEDVGFDKKKRRGIARGGRIMYLTRSPAFDAKNRYGLPDKLPFTWEAFANAYAERAQ